MEKRILALVLAFCLAIAVQPFGVAAYTGASAEEAVETAEIQAETIATPVDLVEEIVEEAPATPAEEAAAEEAAAPEEEIKVEETAAPVEEAAAEEASAPAEVVVSEPVTLPADEKPAEEVSATIASVIAAEGAAYVKTARSSVDVFSGADMYKRELVGTIKGSGVILYATARVETADDVAVKVAFADESGSIQRGYVNEKDLAESPLTVKAAKKAITTDVSLNGDLPLAMVTFVLPVTEEPEVVEEVTEEPEVIEEITEEPEVVEEITEEPEVVEEITEEPEVVEEITEEPEVIEEITEEPEVIEEVTEEPEVVEEIIEEPEVVEEVTEEPEVVEEITEIETVEEQTAVGEEPAPQDQFTVDLVLTYNSGFPIPGTKMTLQSVITGEIDQPSYQWQQLENGEWVDMPGEQGSALVVVLNNSTFNRMYRVVVSNGKGE